jgi:pimeloyl-ACP methyl ester carboxylesterase
VPEILTTDGVHLWASDDGSGPPVVLVAGYTAPAASWALRVEALNVDQPDEFGRVLLDFLGEL